MADRNISDLSEIRRTWKERLFTRPWRPWERHRIVKDPKAYGVGDNIWLVSYETYKKVLIERSIGQKNIDEER